MFERVVPSRLIAKDLRMHVRTVEKWRRAWRTVGRDSLLGKPHPGRPALLSDDQKQELVQMLRQEPTAHGFERHFWTTRMIADLVHRRFGVQYHRDWIGEMLHALGMSWQKPMRRARERDEAKIEAWRSDLWPELEKKNAAENGVIVFADETGFLMNPSVKKTWAPAGKTPVVVYRNRHHQKVSVLGALAYQPHNGFIEAICDFHPDAYVRSGEAAAFVHRLLAEFPDQRIDLIWDNLNAHRSKLVKELSTQYPRLHLHFLPGYAPDLNPSEMLWCLSKYHRSANHAIDNVLELQAEAQRTIGQVANRPDLLDSCFAHAGLRLLKTSAQ
jgi:transposase